MFKLIICNENKIRTDNNIGIIKNPSSLEVNLLYIVNQRRLRNGFKSKIKEFNPEYFRICNELGEYYTSSNYYIWGLLPMSYIYNDMIRHIKNLHTTSNFILTTEIFHVDRDTLESLENNRFQIIHDIVTRYIYEGYISMGPYVFGPNHGLLLMDYYTSNGDYEIQIILTGFNPSNMASWFSSSEINNQFYNLAFIREQIMRNIVGDNFECIRYRDHVRNNIASCYDYVNKLEMVVKDVTAKSIYDESTKYQNYNLNYDILNYYDRLRPAYYTPLETNKYAYQLYTANYNANQNIDILKYQYTSTGQSTDAKKSKKKK